MQIRRAKIVRAAMGSFHPMGMKCAPKAFPIVFFIKARTPKHPRQFVNTHTDAIMKTSAKLMIVRLIKFHLMLVYSAYSLERTQ